MAAWSVYLVAIVVGLIIYRLLKRERRNLPNGPWAWPVIGNGPDLVPFGHISMTKWVKKYGDIYTIYFGRYRTIVLSDPKLVREAFNEPALAGKPDDEIFTLISDGPHGIINSQGQEWVEQRRFTLRHLRDFGFGKTTGEELITNEMREFIGGLEKNTGQPISLNKSFGVAVLNTLWMMVAGVRYDQDDPRLWGLLKENENVSKKISKNPLLLMLPEVARRIPKLSGWTELVEVLGKFRAISMEHVNRHLEEVKPDDDGSRDFIDAYLQEIKGTTDPNSSFYKEVGLRSLACVVSDLFVAGSDTTSTTLSWIVLYLAKFPHVQAKLQAELDEVVGKSRSPTLADRPKMPYAEAVIAEAMRLSSIVPNGLFHRAMQDVSFHGYDIPKGTFIVANFYYIHRSPRFWEEPEEFRPDRFLSSDGKSFKKSDNLMAFSLGKRACLGETLARDTLFLYFTNLYHRFDIQFADESKDATLEPATGFLLMPQDFKVVLKERL